jgi:hypothetical protein
METVHDGYFLNADGGEVWDFWTGSGPGWNEISGGAVAYNQWTHLVATYDGANMVLYVNGQKAASSPAVLTPNGADPLYIGGLLNGAAGSTPVWFWPGSIDEVAVYAAPLTAAQVLDHYLLATTQILQAQFSSDKLTLTWAYGTLLQATNVLGPWTTNLAPSPLTVTPSNAQMYYRLRVQ